MRIITFKPPVVSCGQKVGILGNGFNTAETITINNTNLDFKIENDNLITLSVPEGLESGFVIVNNEIKSNIKLTIVNTDKAIVREEFLN